MRYHFIAIGGIGMSGLAKYLLEDGHEVSGSDIVESKYVDQLRSLGAKDGDTIKIMEYEFEFKE